MSVLVQAGYASQTNGTTVTVANSDDFGDDPCLTPAIGAGGSITYSTAHPGSGPGVTIVGAASVSTYLPYSLAVTDDTVDVEFYYEFTALPTAELSIAVFVNTNGTTATTLLMNTSGTLRLRDFTSSSSVSGSNAIGSALSVNTRYRIAVQLKRGVGTTDGVVSMATYVGSSTTPLASPFSSTTGFNLGAADFDRVLFGRVPGSAGTTTQYFGGAQLADNYPTGSFIGPYSATAPVASAGTAQTNVDRYSLITLNGSATNTPITGWAWTQTGGTTQTLSSSSVQTPTFTPTKSFSAETLTFSLTATNSSGTSTAATTTVALLPCTVGVSIGSGAANPGRAVRVI